MIGKKPVMNTPAVGSPAKKRCRSPVTTAPAALVNSPKTNQTMLLSTWCSPSGSNRRLRVPKVNAPSRPAPRSHSPTPWIASCTGGHT